MNLRYGYRQHESDYHHFQATYKPKLGGSFGALLLARTLCVAFSQPLVAVRNLGTPRAQHVAYVVHVGALL